MRVKGLELVAVAVAAPLVLVDVVVEMLVVLAPQHQSSLGMPERMDDLQ